MREIKVVMIPSLDAFAITVDGESVVLLDKSFVYLNWKDENKIKNHIHSVLGHKMTSLEIEESIYKLNYLVESILNGSK